MTETVSIDFRRPVPIFPLPGSTLLPHTAVPLHVFEPRYRRMTGDVLDTHGLIAMGLYDESASRHDYADGKPPLRPFVCVGYVTQYEKLSDGRYLLLLQGLCRARVVEEVDHEPYRMARLEPTELPPREDEELVDHREELQALLHDPVLDDVEAVEDLRPLLEQEEVPTAALIDVAIMQLCEDDEQRYDMLCEPDAMSRATWLEHRLEELREQVEEAADDDDEDDLLGL
ncbi:MAG: LON peptidase substrate-binding domain-containing protein [Phycisphaeraceae bacterium]